MLPGCPRRDCAPGISAAPPLSGAIFTTNADGSVVNGNTIYADKCDVYLDGGPPPQEAAGLPDGDYYFQVTDPSGKKLLSTDPVANRRITVSGGIITGADNHPTNPDLDHAGGAAMDDLIGHSITYRIALGSGTGRKAFTLQTVPERQ